MPHPRLDPNVQLEIKTFRAEGLSIDGIIGSMSVARLDGFSAVPARRTVAKYAKEYDLLPDEVKALDAPFEWSKMDAYRLPASASQFILNMMYMLIITRKTPEAQQLPGPTVRQVQWWWKVSNGVPDLPNPIDTSCLADCFVARELLHHLCDLPLFTSDLDAIMVYQPWASNERWEAYEKAIEERRIPRFYNPLDRREVRRDVAKVGKDKWWPFMISSMVLEQIDFPRYLPSVWLSKDTGELSGDVVG